MDKINFENLPSTNTPLSASNLNTMQSNIEKSVVAVGSTQPSTSEKVWIKKGNNLFNKNLGFINAYINVNAEIIADRYNALFNQHIPVKAGETYTVKANQNVFNMYMNFFEADGTFISYQGSATTTQQITVTAPQNAEYALLQFNYDGSTTVTSTIIDSLDLMIVQGQTAGTYEAYVEKEILVKNDNGVFEEFYNEYKIPAFIKSKVVSDTPDSNGFVTTGLDVNNVIIGVSKSNQAGFFTPFIEKNANRLTLKCETWDRYPITTPISLMVHYIEI